MTAAAQDLFARTFVPPPDPVDREWPSRRIPYQPALDGLRGVAVAAVLLYHGGVGWAAGGYLGVDAFFVLSGYLITRLLVQEWRSRGWISLRRFWANRVRRLLPPLVVLLVGVSLWCLALDPVNLARLRGDGLATLAYSMNWRLVASSQSYFDQFYSSPLRHAWSLAIEEQFYLVWPIVVVLVLRATGSVRALCRVATGLAAASAAVMVLHYDGAVDPSRLYYGTDTRAQSLLIGSALAAAVGSGFRVRDEHRRPVLRVTGAGTGVLAMAWMGLPGEHALLYRGGLTIFALLVALVVLACTGLGDNRIRTALAWRPLRGLGLISYGVYLYHYPLFLWLDRDRTGLEEGSVRLLVLRVTASLAVATVSYVALERPIRRGVLNRVLAPRMRLLVTPGAVVVVVALLAGATTGGTSSSRARTPGAAAATIPGNISPDDRRVLLVGDSVAYTLGVGFEGEVSQRDHLAVWNHAVLFCELIPAPRRENGTVVAPSRTCENWETEWRRDVAEFRPAVSVLQLGAWEIFDRQVDGRWIEFGSPQFDTLLTDVLSRAVAALSSQGAPVALLTTPRFLRNDGISARVWTQNDPARTDRFNALLRAVAARNPGIVHIVDLAAFVCPGNVCPAEIGGIRMRDDGLHYDGDDARLVAGWLAPQLAHLAGERLPAGGGAPG